MGCTTQRSGRAGKVLLAAGVLIAGLAMAIASNPSASMRGAGGQLHGSIASSQYPVDTDIEVANYTAPDFTWSEPVTFNFTVDSNISAVVTVSIQSDVFEPFIYNMNVVNGLNPLVVTLGVSPYALPGEHLINITFTHTGNNATFSHEIWVGTSVVISYGILFGALGFTIAIYAKVGSPKKPKTSTPGSSGSAASAADDDTSTVTYVDQSQAPPGRIYCPECKKVIEEGSIFCPECGTRIPRYLRYHP
jgi:hypothetical protein